MVPLKHVQLVLLAPFHLYKPTRQTISTHHARADQELRGLLHRLHVHPPSQVQVRVQQIPVPVLLGRPSPGPDPPRGGARPGLVSGAVQSVEHGLVGGERLLGDCVTDQADEVVVRQASGALAQLADAVEEVLVRGDGEEVLRGLR